MSPALIFSGEGRGFVSLCDRVGKVGDMTTTFIWEAVKPRKSEHYDHRYKPSHWRGPQFLVQFLS
jgi:hypothetical protein